MNATRYDYNKLCVTVPEAMDMLGFTNKDTFTNKLAKTNVEYQHAKGRRPALLSLSAINVLAKMWDKDWVTIPDDIKNRATVSVQESIPVTPKETSTPYWERKANALAELYDMTLEDVLNEAVRQYIDKMTEAKT